MEITERTENGAVIALLTGKLDSANAAVLEQWLMDRTGVLSDRLIMDFGGLSYICSAGLRVVLSLAREMKNSRRSLGICGLYGSVREVFMVSGFIQILPIYNSIEDALANG